MAAEPTFTQEDLNAIYQKAAEKQWSYPYLFNSLKKLGVERYEVDVLRHETLFVGGGGSLVAKGPADFGTLKVGSFSLDALKKAIERSQKREIDYRQFLVEIAAAGVAFYRVDMRPRTVTYHGSTPKQKLIEVVPAT